MQELSNIISSYILYEYYNNSKNKRNIQMSIEQVKNYFRKWDKEQDIMVFNSFSATVAEAAETILS